MNVKECEWTLSRREGSHGPMKRTVRVMWAGMQIKEILLQVSKSSSEAQAGRSCRRNSALFHELVTGYFLASQYHARTKVALRYLHILWFNWTESCFVGWAVTRAKKGPQTGGQTPAPGERMRGSCMRVISGSWNLKSEQALTSCPSKVSASLLHPFYSIRQ